MRLPQALCRRRQATSLPRRPSFSSHTLPMTSRLSRTRTSRRVWVPMPTITPSSTSITTMPAWAAFLPALWPAAIAVSSRTIPVCQTEDTLRLARLCRPAPSLLGPLLVFRSPPRLLPLRSCHQPRAISTLSTMGASTTRTLEMQPHITISRC